MASFDDIFDDASKDAATYAVFCCLRIVLLNDFLVRHSNIITNCFVDMVHDEEYETFKMILLEIHQNKVMDLSDILPFIDKDFYK